MDTISIISIYSLNLLGSIHEIEKIFLVIFMGLLLCIFILKVDMIDSIISVIISEVMFETLIYILLGMENSSGNLYFISLGTTGKILMFCGGFFLDAVLMIAFYKVSSLVMKKFIVKNSINYIKLIYVVVTLIIALTNLEYYKSVRNLNESKIFIINLIIMVVYCILSLAIVNVFNEYEKEKEELTYQKFYNETLEYLMEDLRRFKHDYNNKLAVFGGYLQLGKYDELKKYYKEVAVDCNCNMFSNNKSILKIKNAGLLGLLFYKLKIAKQKNVVFFIDIKNTINHIDMKINDFCEMLGILIDNAIESAEKTQERQVFFDFYSEDKYYIFQIENSVEEKVDIKNIYKKDYTTKGTNRGMGLYIVKNIIKNNTNIRIKTRCTEDRFIQKIYLTQSEKSPASKR